MTPKKWLILPISAVLALGVAACGDDDDDDGGSGGGGGVSGKIAIDGSSTVFPFAQAAAEEFQAENPDVKITVGQSGTGGGFEKFCAGETDISDASRPINSEEEVPVCEKNGVTYKELQVAIDGIAVVTNPALEVECLTTDQLKQIWEPARRWRASTDVDPELPDAKLSLYGPGTDSGHVRLLHRGDQRRGGQRPARTTSRPRTTTCSSRAWRVTRAASATSATPTTSRTRTS